MSECNEEELHIEKIAERLIVLTMACVVGGVFALYAYYGVTVNIPEYDEYKIPAFFTFGVFGTFISYRISKYTTMGVKS